MCCSYTITSGSLPTQRAREECVGYPIACRDALLEGCQRLAPLARDARACVLPLSQAQQATARKYVRQPEIGTTLAP
ncbi:hypothetical protein PSAB6_180049 [Paraburkholderia sabiae]|nr:hypothetical protein PSAB6_180049 [Paraburkholderia sabiae]